MVRLPYTLFSHGLFFSSMLSDLNYLIPSVCVYVCDQTREAPNNCVMCQCVQPRVSQMPMCSMCLSHNLFSVRSFPQCVAPVVSFYFFLAFHSVCTESGTLSIWVFQTVYHHDLMINYSSLYYHISTICIYIYIYTLYIWLYYFNGRRPQLMCSSACIFSRTPMGPWLNRS